MAAQFANCEGNLKNICTSTSHIQILSLTVCKLVKGKLYQLTATVYEPIHSREGGSSGADMLPSAMVSNQNTVGQMTSPVSRGTYLEGCVGKRQGYYIHQGLPVMLVQLHVGLPLPCMARRMSSAAAAMFAGFIAWCEVGLEVGRMHPPFVALMQDRPRLTDKDRPEGPGKHSLNRRPRVSTLRGH